MKHLKIVLLTLLIAVIGLPDISIAQRTSPIALKAYTQAGVYKATPDTVTNTDTTYLYISDGSAIKALNQYQDVVLSFGLVPSITGTTTGSIVVQGSMSGTFSRSSAPISDWTTLTPSTAYSTSDSTSYTSPSAGGGLWGSTMYRQFIIPNNQHKYLRIRYISGGTQTSVLTGTASSMAH